MVAIADFGGISEKLCFRGKTNMHLKLMHTVIPSFIYYKNIAYCISKLKLQAWMNICDCTWCPLFLLIDFSPVLCSALIIFFWIPLIKNFSLPEMPAFFCYFTSPLCVLEALSNCLLESVAVITMFSISFSIAVSLLRLSLLFMSHHIFFDGWDSFLLVLFSLHKKE